jgi:hypothetical protein
LFNHNKKSSRYNEILRGGEGPDLKTAATATTAQHNLRLSPLNINKTRGWAFFLASTTVFVATLEFFSFSDG